MRRHDTHRARRRWWQMQQCRQMRQAAAAVMLVLLAMTVGCVCVAQQVGCAAENDRPGCQARMVAPIRDGVVIRAFDEPAEPWLAGHRGVDLAAGEGDDIVAPIDGTISFRGKVGGKSVVSMVHAGWTLTFEPAVTDLSVGASLRRGQPLGMVGHGSDHCDGSCLHWGIRLDGRRYRDPESFLTAMRIRLLPVR
ncbi:M23 family metallopeptidase [Bifidobacterium cuniculi]|uniref:M23 peptidase domain protein n=2 Tax=Bifidobacterium cuniculi TaxID=1688 RepID=A0A087AVW9_9BIFI|nr:M23 family metallopeptidase [Bifidobacterium cuniculi]KFI62919.1 M23 peptidase domain protein [Bifidobacterium cuniculi]